jgi:hypothetical protein
MAHADPHVPCSTQLQPLDEGEKQALAATVARMDAEI